VDSGLYKITRVDRAYPALVRAELQKVPIRNKTENTEEIIIEDDHKCKTV